MSRDRIEPCKFYVCENSPCKKGRTGEHNGYCQRCDKYRARARVHHVNRKKQELQKIREKEMETN